MAFSGLAARIKSWRQLILGFVPIHVVACQPLSAVSGFLFLFGPENDLTLLVLLLLLLLLLLFLFLMKNKNKMSSDVGSVPDYKIESSIMAVREFSIPSLGEGLISSQLW